jgi:tRNA U34 5-methylaminomethyl-2-thiouridine-forming methyltransferase MnmC
MKKVITKDSSETFFNEKVQEHYHSTSGAVEESLKKFAEPCIEYLEKKEVRILDMCFGLGYNSSAIIDLLAGKKQKITIIALENDEEILKQIKNVNPKLESYFLIKKSVEKKEYKTIYKNTKSIIKLLLGDARQTIKQVKNIDAVLFDPFSPKKQPELWTKQFLQDVHKAMNKNAPLTTYSCAKTFRDTLRELNFQVLNGPCVGRRAPSTVAIK